VTITLIASEGPPFLTVISYVSSSPTMTGSGVSDLKIDRSDLVITCVCSLALFGFSESGSGSDAEEDTSTSFIIASTCDELTS